MRRHAGRPVEADSFRFPRSKAWTVSSKVWTAEPDENRAWGGPVPIQEGLSLSDGENHGWTRMDTAGEEVRPERPVPLPEDLALSGRVCPFGLLRSGPFTRRAPPSAAGLLPACRRGRFSP